jgi:plasmid stabilization system protein ParE
MFDVRHAPEAEDDLLRLYDHLVERVETTDQLSVAVSAIAAIRSGMESLSRHPFLYRKHDDDPLLRELLIPFGTSGYVALYRILDAGRVLVLAVRHQIEDDYH